MTDQVDVKALRADEIVDLYWHTTGDDWAIPEHIMLAFARAIEKRIGDEVSALRAENQRLRECVDDPSLCAAVIVRAEAAEARVDR